MKKILAFLLIMLMMLTFPSSILAATDPVSTGIDEYVTLDAMTDKFPEADFSASLVPMNLNLEDGVSMAQACAEESITPRESYSTTDEEGVFNLDIYADGSFNYYGAIYAGATVSGDGYTGINYTGNAPANGAGYVTYYEVRPFWSTGSSPVSPYQYMYFYMDYRMRNVNGTYSGSILDVYNGTARPGAAYLAIGYSFVPYSSPRITD